MVKIQTASMTTINGMPWPVMHQHKLKVLKEFPSFKEGDTVTCFIAKYEGGRYCVFTASFIRVDNYHVFDSAEELHEHFNEL